MMFHIYYLIDPRDNQPFYVGYTKSEKKRLGRHIKEVNQLKNHGRCESNNLMKVGVIRQILETNSKPIFTIIKSTDDFDRVKELEIEHISKFGLRILNTGSLTNMTLGGEGSKGRPKSEEECFRRTVTRKATGLPWHSKETRGLISESRTGYKTGKPAWNSGKTKDTDESVKKISESCKGHIPWNKNISKDDPRRQTGNRNGFFQKNHSEETRLYLSNIAQNRPKYECQYCGKPMTISNLNRWHNDNCKERNMSKLRDIVSGEEILEKVKQVHTSVLYDDFESADLRALADEFRQIAYACENLATARDSFWKSGGYSTTT